MSELDVSKEQMSYLNVRLGILVVKVISVFGWLISNLGTATAILPWAAVISVVSLSAGIFMSGSRAGEVVQIETAGSPPSVSIGRVAPCELMISDDPDLSRRHARMVWNGSSWMLDDLDCSNGTFIGEFQAARRLSGPAASRDGHILRVGLTRLRFGSAKDERLATAAAAANPTRS